MGRREARTGRESRLMRKSTSIEQETHFLNVDLQIESDSDLVALVSALERRLFPLYGTGPYRGRHYAYFEVRTPPTDTDQTIRDLCKAVKALRGRARRVWTMATIRRLNIGVQSGLSPSSKVFTISKDALKLACNVGAEIVFTVYGTKCEYSELPTPQPRASSPKASRPSKPRSRR
jgi:hypothetical protein